MDTPQPLQIKDLKLRDSVYDANGMDNKISCASRYDVVSCDYSEYLSCQLSDNAINYIGNMATNATGQISAQIPPMFEGKCRDFIIVVDNVQRGFYCTFDTGVITYMDASLADRDMAYTPGETAMFSWTEFASNRFMLSKKLMRSFTQE